VLWYSTKVGSWKLDVGRLRKALKVPGEHNLSNAAAVLAIARVVGVKKNLVLRGLGNYRGSWRRMEFRGAFHALRSTFHVFDDYAHHPTEIKATLGSFREKFPGSKLICVYQPHQARRLKSLFKEFVTAFEAADVLVLLPVYEASGRDACIRGYNSPSLLKAIHKKHSRKTAYYLNNPKNIKSFLSDVIQPLTSNISRNHFVIVMMGAGDIIKYTPLLID